MISNLQPLPVGPFSIQKIRIDLTSADCCKRGANTLSGIVPFTVTKDTLVLITKGTLYVNVNDVEYAEPEGYVRYLKPGDKVYFTTHESVSELLFEYAEFTLISI